MPSQPQASLALFTPSSTATLESIVGDIMTKALRRRIGAAPQESLASNVWRVVASNVKEYRREVLADFYQRQGQSSLAQRIRDAPSGQAVVVVERARASDLRVRILDVRRGGGEPAVEREYFVLALGLQPAPPRSVVSKSAPSIRLKKTATQLVRDDLTARPAARATTPTPPPLKLSPLPVKVKANANPDEEKLILANGVSWSKMTAPEKARLWKSDEKKARAMQEQAARAPWLGKSFSELTYGERGRLANEEPKTYARLAAENAAKNRAC
jgi:hypothetical protein